MCSVCCCHVAKHPAPSPAATEGETLAAIPAAVAIWARNCLSDLSVRPLTLCEATVTVLPMDLEEALAALRTAEPRNIPGHLPMDVSIVPRPNGGWRASFAWRHDAGSGPLLVRGSAELIEGRLTITELCLDVAKTEPADVAEDEFWQELGPPTARIDAATYRSIPI